FQDRWCGLATIGDGTVRPHVSDTVDRLTASILCTGHGPFEASLLRRHCAGTIVDPDMVMLVHIESADLAKQPVILQWLRPRGIDHKIRRLRCGRPVVDS